MVACPFCGGSVEALGPHLEDAASLDSERRAAACPEVHRRWLPADEVALLRACGVHVGSARGRRSSYVPRWLHLVRGALLPGAVGFDVGIRGDAYREAVAHLGPRVDLQRGLLDAYRLGGWGLFAAVLHRRADPGAQCELMSSYLLGGRDDLLLPAGVARAPA